MVDVDIENANGYPLFWPCIFPFFSSRDKPRHEALNGPPDVRVLFSLRADNK
jgi:hypothetical protein